MNRYVLGFDFGTLSCRGVVLDLSDGKLVATAEHMYRNGVISGKMKHNPIYLKKDWFLQDPDDWIESMTIVSKKMLSEAGIAPEEISGIGTDFTSCTLLPIKKDGTPLCKLSKYRDCPNAWPKLWKHHGAQGQAERIEKYAREHTTWLKKYFGNSVSSEWAYPKMLQVLEEDPDIYKEADYFIEAVDWIVMKLTGVNCRTNGILGVNAFYIEGKGFPDRDFAKAIHPLFENVAETKLAGEILKVGDCAGLVTDEMSKVLGVSTHTVVAAGHSDGAVAGCGVGVTKSGSMMLVMGTSTCHQMMYKDLHSFDGICSIASDGMIPGLFGYESGQPATGDMFAWFADHMASSAYQEEAKRKNKSVLSYLGDLAQELQPGSNGLIALDWFNGNRSVLSNYNLSGAIIGLTLDTKPEELYRALVEANVFGSKKIIENYEQNGILITDVYAVGGIPRKSPWIMQMCADVLKKEIIVPEFENVPARGAAVCAAVAVGKKNPSVGVRDFKEAGERLIPKEVKRYYPDMEKAKKYDRVYQYYCMLHDLFGRDDSFMKGLKELRLDEVCHE